eukprot:gene26845-20785_t
MSDAAPPAPDPGSMDMVHHLPMQMPPESVPQAHHLAPSVMQLPADSVSHMHLPPDTGTGAAMAQQSKLLPQQCAQQPPRMDSGGAGSPAGAVLLPHVAAPLPDGAAGGGKRGRLRAVASGVRYAARTRVVASGKPRRGSAMMSGMGAGKMRNRPACMQWQDVNAKLQNLMAVANTAKTSRDPVMMWEGLRVGSKVEMVPPPPMANDSRLVGIVVQKDPNSEYLRMRWCLE